MKYGYMLQLLIDGLGKHYSKQQNMVTKDHMASLIAHLIKNLPAMQETWVRFLGSKVPWRRKWQPTPALLPGRSHGQRSLIDYSPWGRKESDTTEQLHFHF